MMKTTHMLPALGLFLAFAPDAALNAQGPAGAPAALMEPGQILLPGDMPPPPLANMIAPPRPPGQRPPDQPNTNPAPTLQIALEAAQAAMDRCKADGLKVGVAVSDSAGHLLVGLTMDGASPGRIFTGSRKNAAAVAFKMPTSAVQDRLRAGDQEALAMLKPHMAVFPGAVPLVAGDRLLGAIGVSGATGQQDEICAAAGAARVQGRLK